MASIRECLASIGPEEVAFQSFPAYIALQNSSYRFARHNEILASVLEKVERGEIRRLIVDCPPRHGKTMQIGEYFPAWYLGRNPSHQVVYATYAFERAGDVGRKVRNQLIDATYQKVFPESGISPDSRGVNRLSTVCGGNFFAVGVGGVLTGRGANCVTGKSIVITNYGEIPISEAFAKTAAGRPVKVLSYNHITGEPEFRPILAVMVNEGRSLLRVTTRSGRSITATINHEFCANGEYVRADELRVGDCLSVIEPGFIQAEMREGKSLLRWMRFRVFSVEPPDPWFWLPWRKPVERSLRGPGGPAGIVDDPIVKIEPVAPEMVYDLEVEGNHNFFANDLLVHNCLIIDDPHKSRKEVESETQRNQVISWYQSVAYQRLMPDNRIILVMTRWHYADLAGWILDEMRHEKWYLLRMPAVCDSTDDIMGRKPGEALWPSDYPLEVLNTIRETIGTTEWNAQYQQQPLPSEGGMVKIEWFRRYDFAPWAGVEFVLKADANATVERANIPYDFRRIVISADTAFKERQINDPSAFTVWGITGDHRFYLLRSEAERLNYPLLRKKAIDLWMHYSRVKTGTPIMMLIEDKGSGQSLVQDLQAATTMPVVALKGNDSKQIRMSTASPLIESGRVYLPERASWLVPYETQIIRFPAWKEDDLVDSTSQFLNWAGQPLYVKAGKRFWK